MYYKTVVFHIFEQTIKIKVSCVPTTSEAEIISRAMHILVVQLHKNIEIEEGK